MYPLGTRYDPSAPWNEAITYPEDCKACKGNGKIWYAYDIEKDIETPCTEEEYNSLPDTEEQAVKNRKHIIKGCCDICEDCEGKGYIY